MSRQRFSRRRLLLTTGLIAVAAPLVQACGQAATPTPEIKRPEPTAAAKAAAAAATKPPAPTAAAKAAQTAPKAAAPAVTGQKIPLTITVWTDSVRTWMTDRSNDFAKEHPEVDLKQESVPYADMSKKQLAYAASGTTPDVLFSGVKWAHYSAFKGIFYWLDSLVKTTDPGMDDFVPDAIAGSKLEGKLFALPFEVNSGNQNVVVYNKNLLDEKGLKEPTDNWTMDEFAETAAKLTDKPKKVFGTNYLTTNYYDFATLSRSYGVELLVDDDKKFNLLDPKNIEAARWQTELRTKLNAAPVRAEAEGLQFAAGQIGLQCTGFYGIVTATTTVGDKFKWGAVLGPVHPQTGLRGYEIFVTQFNMGAKTKNPEKAYELLMYMTSKDTQTFALGEQGQAPSRKSVWLSPAAQKISPVYERGINWMTDGKNKGPFPMPYNLRFQELQDKFGNLAPPVFYGEVDFDEGLRKVQQECQAIMDQPRG